jgi:hypothetical protein
MRRNVSPEAELYVRTWQPVAVGAMRRHNAKVRMSARKRFRRVLLASRAIELFDFREISYCVLGSPGLVLRASAFGELIHSRQFAHAQVVGVQVQTGICTWLRFDPGKPRPGPLPFAKSP